MRNPATPTRPSTPTIGGRIHFDDASKLAFEDLTSIIFVLPEGAESIPQNVNEWPREYSANTRSRSAPLRWVRSIEILEGAQRDRYRALFDVRARIMTATGVSFVSSYASLEWVRFLYLERAPDGPDDHEPEPGEIDSEVVLLDRTIYFAGEDGRNITKIELGI